MAYREGFALAGAWLIEREKIIVHYPEEGGSTRIQAERQSVGGEAFRLAGCLRAATADLPLYAIGCVGEDEDGHAVLNACHQLDIDTYQLHALAESATAHAEIMVSASNGSRTPYYFAGANDLFGLEHFDFRHCLGRWLHLGEIHLLGGLWARDEDFGTIAARVLHLAKTAGLVTSWSISAQQAGLEPQQLRQILSQTDYLLVPERALAAIAQRLLEEDAYDCKEWEQLARAVLACGVRAGALVYSAEASFALLSGGEGGWQNNSNLALAASQAISVETVFAVEFLQRCYEISFSNTELDSENS